MIGTKLQDSLASLALTTVRVVAPSHLVYGKSSALASPYTLSTPFSPSSDSSTDLIRKVVHLRFSIATVKIKYDLCTRGRS